MAVETIRGQKTTVVSAAGVVKAAAGRLVKVIVTVAGSGGTLTVYDNASAASGTILYSVAGTTALGTIADLDIPAANGIYVSPGTGQTVLVVWA